MFNFRPPAPPIQGGFQPMTSTPVTTSSTYFQPSKFGQQIRFNATSEQNLFQQQSNQQQQFPQFSNPFQTSNNPNYFENQLEFASLAINSQTYQCQNQKISDNNQLPIPSVENINYELKKFKEQKENEIMQKDAEFVQLKSELENLKSENEILLKDKIENLKELDRIKELSADEEELNQLKERLQNSQLIVNNMEKSFVLLEKQLKEIKKGEEYLKQEKENHKFNLKTYKNEREFMQQRYEQEINKLTDELKNQENKCGKFRDAARKFELEKNLLLNQIEELKAEDQAQIEEYESKIHNCTLYVEEKQKELQECEMKLQEYTTKLKEVEEENGNLKTQLSCIDEMKSIQEELKAKITSLEKEVQNRQKQIAQKEQEMQAENGRLTILCKQYEQLENESFNMAEDLKNLYFKIKELKTRVIELKNIQLNLKLKNEELNNELVAVKQENNKLSEGKEELVIKMQIIEATQSSVKDITDKLGLLLQNKDTEHQRILNDKDEIIRELRQQNAEYMEKIQLVQMEKEKVFRNFHEMMLTTFKTTPSISTVTPLVKQSGTPEKSQSSQNVASQKSADDSSLLQTMKAIVSTPTKKSKPEEYNIELDMIPATQSPRKETNQTMFSPIQNKASPFTDVANTPIKTGSVLAALREAQITSHQTTKPGILTNPSRVKRKLSFTDVSKKVSKTVRFADDNDKGNQKASAPRRTQDKNKKEKSSGIDMSFVKHKLDQQKNKIVGEKNNENEKSKTKGTKDTSWIDDIFSF